MEYGEGKAVQSPTYIETSVFPVANNQSLTIASGMAMGLHLQYAAE